VKALPSIASRLGWALASWSVAGGLAVMAAVWLTVSQEVNELLDDGLEAAAAMLVADLPLNMAGHSAAAPPPTAQDNSRFAWQLVSPDGALLRRSAQAPPLAFSDVPRPGFSDAPHWRLFGLATGRDGVILYAAQSRAERREARAEAALYAALAVLAVSALGHVWLTRRVRQELAPLQALSLRLAEAPAGPGGADDGAAPVALGRAPRRELQPVHDAVDGLTLRLHRRLLSERAFAGHAAHALRTPLAGIDAQLAMAVREAGPEQQPRLARLREAGTRLQGVVAALLALFRSGGDIQVREVDVAALLARLPAAGLSLRWPAAGERQVVRADEDLLAAALLNLLDNAVRHGASTVVLGLPADGVLRLHDDGPGVSAARRAELQAALEAGPGQAHGHSAVDDAALLGLGLTLAARVAQVHGGRVVLPAVARGFAVELWLGGAGAGAVSPSADLQGAAAH